LLEFVNHSSSCPEDTGTGVGVGEGVGVGVGVGLGVGVGVGVGDGLGDGVGVGVFVTVGVGVDVGMIVDCSGWGEKAESTMANGVTIRPRYTKTCFATSSIRTVSISGFTKEHKIHLCQRITLRTQAELRRMLR
jgi:hypothetical protein